MSRTLFLLALAACSDSATIGDGYKVVVRTMENPPSKLDVLFVVDDSISITDDQQALVAATRAQLFPQLEAEMPDLHVGVVSTSINMFEPSLSGAGGCYSSEGNVLPDGRLLTGSWKGNATCAMTTAPYLATDGTVANFTGDLVDAFGCIATIGHDGCGIEQPLEAMRLGLTLHENAGFLRDEAALLVVFLTDEDDSSKLEGSLVIDDADRLIDQQREYEFGVVCDEDIHELGEHTLCVPRPNTTHIAPIEDYVAFLKALKQDPAMVMVAGIAPPTGQLTTIPNPFAVDGRVAIASICTPPPGPCIDDPLKTCARSEVAPAIRLTAFAASFPSRYELPSICDATTDAAVHRIERSVANILANGTCVSGDIVPDRCRAFSVDANGTRRAIPLAFVEDDDACDYTASHLRADATPRDAEHLEVECL